MTCIVGYVDRENNAVYLGGDSLASDGWIKTVCKQRKVFHSKDTKELIIGISGAFNLQILEYKKLLNEATLLKNEIDREYLITQLIPKLKDIVNENNANQQDDNISHMQGDVLLGYKNKLYCIQENYSLLENDEDFNAIGSGYQIALGSLYTTKNNNNLTIVEKIIQALEAAETFCTGVQRPFYIINTKNEDIVEIK